MTKTETKEILCTLGPASFKERVISRLTDVGVSLFRINLSHTKVEDLKETISFIQSNTKVPICLDTEGAQIRTGSFKQAAFHLKENSIVRIEFKPIEGNEKHFNLYPIETARELEVGDFITIDFNLVFGQIIDKQEDFALLRIITGGTIGQNKAVTLDREITMPPLTQKDYASLEIGVSMGIKHFALSFANRGEDVDEIRRVLGQEAFIISKIESFSGIHHLEEIAARSDGLLIDRGDLSRQVSIEEIPAVQKQIIDRVKKTGRKVYVATNLLESMTSLPSPTRAEVNDVFNTLNDGADGLVLAAETAIGSYPVSCAMMISKIINYHSDLTKGVYSCLERSKTKKSFLVVEPHGGYLVNQLADGPTSEQIDSCKQLHVSLKDLINAEQIAIGAYSPLTGFMTKKEVTEVLKSYQLPSGIFWPMPITLKVGKDTARTLKKGEQLVLLLEGTEDEYAVLKIEDVFSLNMKEREGEASWFLGGDVHLLKRLPSRFKYFEITPRQTRAILENKGWSRIAAFQSNRMPLRSDEYIQDLIFNKYYCDGLFIQAIVGNNEKGALNSDIIIKTHELLLERYSHKKEILFAGLQSLLGTGDVQEVALSAICAKNFGCSHFVVENVSSVCRGFFEHPIFEKLQDNGISLIITQPVKYCTKCRDYVESCLHEDKRMDLDISSVQAMIERGEMPPEWMLRKEVAKHMTRLLKEGLEVFVK